MKKGKLITIEGNEGAGKTTQVRLLAERLEKEGHVVQVVHEPGGTPIGDAIRTIFKDAVLGKGMSFETELFLIQASRAQLFRDVIAPALERGEIVLSDRFTDSTLVYQGFVRGVDQMMIEATSDLATMYRSPDLTLVLHVPVEVTFQRCNRRGAADRLEQEGLPFFNAVCEGFDTISSLSPARCIDLDANRSEEAVHEDIYRSVKKRL